MSEGSASVVVGQTSSAAIAPPPVAPGSEGGFDRAAAHAEAKALLTAQEAMDKAEENGEQPAQSDPSQEKPKADAEGDEAELNHKWVRLRAQEKRFSQRMEKEREAFNKERETFEKERAEHEPLKAARERAKKEPLSALKELGWEFEDLVNYVRNNGQVSQERIMKDLQMSLDEKTQAMQERLEQFEKQEKEKARTAKLGNFQQKVVDEVKSTIDQYPHLKEFVEARGPQFTLQRIFWKMETEAKSKNYLSPGQVMSMFEEELSSVASVYRKQSPAPGGASGRLAKPEAAKPEPRPEPLSNDDGSERGIVDTGDDDDDPDVRRRKARAILAG